ncbi:hypothetical protein KJ966_28070 [bacterium]|nr:hypothetical protein [bacterium]
MIKKLKQKIGNACFIKRVLKNPVDLEIFKKKPTVKFLIGIFFVGFSYIIGWPLISLLGVLAVYFNKPLLFAVGSPITYGFSHLVFLFGIFIAGKDTIVYMNVFAQWSLTRFFTKILGAEIVSSIQAEQEGRTVPYSKKI